MPGSGATWVSTSPDQRIARWSSGPLRDESGLRVTLVGPRKSISAWIPDGEHAVELSEPLGAMPAPPGHWHPADAFLRRIALSSPGGATDAGDRWQQVCRALEVTDAVQRSVQRRRTIELYHEQVTEQETFKSVMAVGGCGMLLWVLLLMMIAGVVEGLRLPLRDTWIWQLWPVVVFAPLGVFLALQLLQLVFPRNGR
jgi:hypothetical protein